MKKIKHLLITFINEWGWFAILIMIASAVTLLLLVSSIITPFINSVVWGTTV